MQYGVERVPSSAYTSMLLLTGIVKSTTIDLVFEWITFSSGLVSPMEQDGGREELWQPSEKRSACCCCVCVTVTLLPDICRCKILMHRNKLCKTDTSSIFLPDQRSGQYKALSQVCCCCLSVVTISRFKELRLSKVSNASRSVLECY